MPEELRPDLCKVILYPPDEQPFSGETVDLIVMEDPKQPGRWKDGSVGRMINSFLHQGLTLCVVSGNRYHLLKPRHGIDGLFKTSVMN